MTTVFETSVTRTLVILVRRSNWKLWYMVIRAAAEGHKIWDFVNPELTAPDLVQPRKPIAADFNSAKLQVSDLDAGERELYKIELTEYQHECTKYDQKKKALSGFTAHILELITQAIIPYIYHCKSPKEILAKLKQQFATTDKTQEKEVLAQYREVCKPPSTKNLEQWLSKWEITYEEALELQLPDVQGTQAVDNFVQALCNVNPAFYGYWTNHLENTDIYPSLSDIVDKFWKQLWKESALTLQHGTFTASFQEEHTNSPWRRTDCVCRQKYHFSECLYLIKS